MLVVFYELFFVNQGEKGFVWCNIYSWPYLNSISIFLFCFLDIMFFV